MARRVDTHPPATGQLSTVTLDQERQLRQTLRKLGIASPPLADTSTKESVQHLRDFEQEGGE